MKATIDRIEDKLAVLLIGDDGSIKLNVPFILLPEGSKEGDILDISIKMDEKETTEAKERVTSLIDKLKSKNK
jgi:type II secretory pathway predicted ATPase ExeA